VITPPASALESKVLRIEHADRRRMVTASVLTLIALPSLWLMTRDHESRSPQVATAGVVVAADASGATAETDPAPPLAMGTAGGAFLEAPDGVIASDAPARDTRVVIAVQAPPAGTSVFARASYRSTISDPGTCLVAGAPYATTVTITNLDNGRRTTCVASLSPVGSRHDAVLHTSRFVEIANLTDSPVPVEITW
jgi:hypothetical protein